MIVEEWVCADDRCKAHLITRRLGKCAVTVTHVCSGRPLKPERPMKLVAQPASVALA